MGKNIFSCLLSMFLISVSFAGTSTWIASGGGSWTDAANWDVQPVNGDLVVFNLSSGGNAKNVRLTAVAPNAIANKLAWSFELKKDNYVSVELYTQTGQLVATPIQHIFHLAGSYNKEMAIGKLPLGTYIIQIKTPAGNDLKRFVVTPK